MIADVDRLVVGEDAGLECQTVSAYNADKWADGNIPLHYIMQCYHYMAVTGKRTWYIAAVILGREFTYRRLVWDDELINRLTSMEEDFWNNHVVPGIIPPPDGSRACDEVIQTPVSGSVAFQVLYPSADKIRWHDLRSTYCTLLLKSDFNPKAVSRLMGHAKERITVDTYGDNQNIMPEEIPELIEYMDEVMPKKKTECSMDSDILDTVIDVEEYMTEIEKNRK